MSLVTLNFARLTLKPVCESHLRWRTFLSNLGAINLWVLELFAMYAMDSQTDGRTDVGRTDKSNAYCPLHPGEGRGHNKHIFNFFSPSDSETILVSPYQTSRQYSDGDTPKGALNAGAWDRNKSRLWTNSWLSIDHCWTCEQLRRTTVLFIAQTAKHQ